MCGALGGMRGLGGALNGGGGILGGGMGGSRGGNDPPCNIGGATWRGGIKVGGAPGGGPGGSSVSLSELDNSDWLSDSPSLSGANRTLLRSCSMT